LIKKLYAQTPRHYRTNLLDNYDTFNKTRFTKRSRTHENILKAINTKEISSQKIEDSILNTPIKDSPIKIEKENLNIYMSFNERLNAWKSGKVWDLNSEYKATFNKPKVGSYPYRKTQ